MNLVADACVAVKWYVRETGFEDADRLLAARADRIELCAPDIFVAETLNALMRKVRIGEVTEEQVRGAADHLRRLSVALIPTLSLMDRALRLATDLKHAFHDCLYLACAEHMRAVFVTADDRFVRKIPAGITSARVVALSAVPGLLASLEPGSA